MKRFLSLVGTLAVCGGVALGAPCAPGSLQNYIDLGAAGCETGVLLFNNFATAPGLTGGLPIDPASVQVTPGGTAYNPNLLFTLNSSANAGDLFDLFFRFNVAGRMAGASIALNSATATGDGAVTGILDVCPGGSFFPDSPSGCPGSPASAIAFVLELDSERTAATSLPISSFFDVFADLTIDGGTNGTAELGSALVGIAAVPEPSAAILAAAGLAAIGLLRRRRTP